MVISIIVIVIIIILLLFVKLFIIRLPACAGREASPRRGAPQPSCEET